MSRTPPGDSTEKERGREREREREKEREKEKERERRERPKFNVPEWAGIPRVASAYLEVHKDGVVVDNVSIGTKAFFLLGRDSELCDIVLENTSVSRQHAAIVHHKESGRYYLIDLQSDHGVFLNDGRIPPNKPKLLEDGVVIRFAASSRKYVVRNTGGGGGTKKRPGEDRNAASVKKNKGEQIRCSHILVKHRGSRRPSSWRQSTITRTLEEAMQRISDLRNRVLQADDPKRAFGEIAERESDCSSAKRKGDLGGFTRGMMQKSVEDCAFALVVGQISDTITSESGVHIILRTG